ncbi:hypothetical protein OsJ_20098 [Oryza sativa Japonica Group]|uniref:Neprosin PEP catalytic domain-containing protein n=1 Tax=Oryza sativa subsp. japonica TaxID=39947 RepID=Q5VQ72_ORYSJ|nr:hypothetical protein OsJ_20098 [Oryza sativa Japonica Group]BAD68403.1 hypothetical protein [Oryza sativa Japonica Group]
MAEARELPGRNSSDPAAVGELARRAFSFGHPHYKPSISNDGWSGSSGTLEVAGAYGRNGPYHGARADVPNWKVDVQPREFSMNYIMVGYTLDKDYRPYPSSDPPKTLANQIVVGLVNDSGAQTNCFNLDCDGFHLQNSSFALGSSWSDSLSQHGGERYGVTLSIHRINQWLLPLFYLKTESLL